MVIPAFGTVRTLALVKSTLDKVTADGPEANWSGDPLRLSIAAFTGAEARPAVPTFDGPIFGIDSRI